MKNSMTIFKMKTENSESEIDYIRRNADKINLSDVAARIKIDPSAFRKIVLNIPEPSGSVRKFPVRCLPELRKYIDELRRR